MKTVVITGIGALTPLGLSSAESCRRLFDSAAPSAIIPITRFDSSALPWRHAAELPPLDLAAHMPRKDLRRYDLFVHYAMLAAREAVTHAALSPHAPLLKHAAVMVGSSRGGISTMELAMGSPRLSAFTMSGSTVSMAASRICMDLGINGPSVGISSACASGSVALGQATQMIQNNVYDLVIAGGSEAPICRFCQQGYGMSGALSRSGIVRPFDAQRDGFVLAEGATMLVLESRDHARRRGAPVLGEIMGYGTTSDALHPTAPSAEGQYEAMRLALMNAGVRAEDLGFISAHATSTRLGDATEARAIEMLSRGGRTAVTALKSHTGHMLAGSGPFEVAAALWALQEGRIPPILGTQGSDCDLDLVCDAARQPAGDTALVNSFGFGGLNASLLVRARQK